MLLLSIFADATHLIGGYMHYTYLSTNPDGNQRYLITLNLYRDCFQSEVPLPSSAPLGVYRNNTNRNKYTEVELPLVKKDFVTPPGTTLCDYYSENVCIEWGFYQGIVTLPPSTSGFHITFERCCRNIQDNLEESGNGTPNQGQTYYVYIPNKDYENSSPVFSGIPSPYMCVNDTTTFDFAAYDKDGDELSYKLVHPYQGASLANSAPPPKDSLDNIPLVTFTPGYTYTKPFGISNGSIANVNAVTGLTTFFSPQSGSYVVAIEVTEKRNGVVLSTVRMDLQILVLNCPPNDRPQVQAPDGQSFIIEAGEPLCFDVTATDPDDDPVDGKDFVKLTAKGPIYDGSNNYTGPAATFTTNDGYGQANGEFCWTPDCDQDRDEPYIVRITAEDDGCPPKFNTMDFTIKVDPFIGADSIQGPRQVCRYNIYSYSAFGFQNTSSFQWDVQGGTIIGRDDSSVVRVYWDASPTASLQMKEISQWGCDGDSTLISIQIDDSPPLPVITGKDTVCENEAPLTYQVTNNAGSTYEWFVQNATIGTMVQNTLNISAYNTPQFDVLVVETNATGCPSDTAKLEVHVSIPNPKIAGPESVCPNATGVAYLVNPEQGSVYSWTVSGGTLVSGDGTAGIIVDWGNVGTGQVTVQETNRFGCVSVIQRIDVDKSYVLKGNPVFGPIAVCELESGVPYESLEVNGSVYKWDISGGTQASGDSSYSITVDWGTAGMGRIGVQEQAWDLVNNVQCLSPFIYLDVTIHPNPRAKTIYGEYELCQFEDSVSYSLNGMPGSSYFWTIDGDSTGFSGQGSFEIMKYWDQAGTFTIQVRETSVAGCQGELVDSTVLIHPKPTTSPISGPDVICPEDVLNKQYQVSGFANSTFQWVLSGEQRFSGQGSDELSVDWEPTAASGYLRVTEMSEFGCPGDTQELFVEIDQLAIDMTYITVGTPDDHIEIHWTTLFGSKADQFTVQRRLPGAANWIDVMDVAGNVYTYKDRSVNPDATAYEYRIIAFNHCGTLISSEVHRSILLTGIEDENFNISTRFSPYLGWVQGVDYYTLLQSLNGATYQDYGGAPVPDVNISIPFNPAEYRKCYRVQAFELGNSVESWSNEVCFNFEPTVYVPTAVTANNDNLNDGFGIVAVAVKDVNIQVYNRWGEKLFETDDINQKWDVTYRGNLVQLGTYMYLIKFTDFEDKIYYRSGTLNVIR